MRSVIAVEGTYLRLHSQGRTLNVCVAGDEITHYLLAAHETKKKMGFCGRRRHCGGVQLPSLASRRKLILNKFMRKKRGDCAGEVSISAFNSK